MFEKCLNKSADVIFRVFTHTKLEDPTFQNRNSGLFIMVCCVDMDAIVFYADFYIAGDS